MLSASSFGLSGSLARGLMDAGWSSAAAVVVRILLAAAVLVPIAVVQLRGRWMLLLRNVRLVAGYGLVAVAGCQLAYFNAVAHMQVGVALLIEYTAPVAVVGWLWLRRGQRPGRLTVLGVLLGAAGLVLVLDLVSGAAGEHRRDPLGARRDGRRRGLLRALLRRGQRAPADRARRRRAHPRRARRCSSPAPPASSR